LSVFLGSAVEVGTHIESSIQQFKVFLLDFWKATEIGEDLIWLRADRNDGLRLFGKSEVTNFNVTLRINKDVLRL
jgi:hypothetical protein